MLLRMLPLIGLVGELHRGLDQSHEYLGKQMPRMPPQKTILEDRTDVVHTKYPPTAFAQLRKRTSTTNMALCLLI